MTAEVSGLEQSARIVEAHVAGQSQEVAQQLKAAATAVRELSVDSDGYEEAAGMVETCALGQPPEIASLMAEISQAIRDKAIDD